MEVFVPISVTDVSTSSQLDWNVVSTRRDSSLMVSPAGTGKTTLLRRLAIQQAHAFAKNPIDEPLPLFISLSQFQETNLNFVNELELLCAPHFANIDVSLLCKHNKLLLFLDGLNEVRYTTLPKLLLQLTALQTEFPSLQCIVSSQDSSLSSISRFRTLQIDALSPPQIYTMMSRWLQVFQVPPPTRDQALEDLQDDSYRNFRQLLTSPLSVVYCADFVRTNGSLPFHEAAFIEGSLQLVLTVRPDRPLQRPRPEFAIQNAILANLAISMNEEPQCALTASALDQLVTTALKKLGSPRTAVTNERLLSHFISSGILTKQGDRYIFTNAQHRSYFLAFYALCTGNNQRVVDACLSTESPDSLPQVLNYFFYLQRNDDQSFEMASTCDELFIDRFPKVQALVKWLELTHRHNTSQDNEMHARLGLLLLFIGVSYYEVAVIDQLRQHRLGLAPKNNDYILERRMEFALRAQQDYSNLVDRALKLYYLFGGKDLDARHLDFDLPESIISLIEWAATQPFMQKIQWVDAMRVLLGDLQEMKVVADKPLEYCDAAGALKAHILEAILIPRVLYIMDIPDLRELSLYLETLVSISSKCAGNSRRLPALSERLLHMHNLTHDRSRITDDAPPLLFAFVPKEVRIDELFIVTVQIQREAGNHLNFLSNKKPGPGLILTMHVAAPLCDPPAQVELTILPGDGAASEELKFPFVARQAGAMLVEVQVFSQANRVGYLVQKSSVI